MSEAYMEYACYNGDDLGAVYSPGSTHFRVWSPTAEWVQVVLYETGDRFTSEQPRSRHDMKKDVDGTWVCTVEGDLNNTYYNYAVTISGRTSEAVDPYARACGVNGERGMVVNLSPDNPQANPEGWQQDTRIKINSPTEAVIYELHVRDISTDPASGIKHVGKYLAFTETGTKTPDGLSTGIDHISELGVTHVHLLPVFDYATVDERRLDQNMFNWGYDPKNYNVPEGSYATDPYNGAVRINEFKQMVKSLHDRGIGVIMDVVYNHTNSASDSNFNMIVPGYYYRQDADGNFSNGSACGNELASERGMVRKFITDSVVYWAMEYHIDGFRFDLMGLHDIDTMNGIRDALDRIDPTILIYGEGWTGGASPLPYEQAALKCNVPKMNNRIAAFSDDIRDGIKGSVFIPADPGYVSGCFSRREEVKFGIVGSVQHPQVDYTRLTSSNAPWANEPTQTVTYASAHDNLTLWDKLIASSPDATADELLAMNRLTAAIVFTSQGITFIQAGEEMARSKDGNENSYQSPDAVNSIKWGQKARNMELLAYYKGLIALRRAYSAFRLDTAEGIRESLRFLDTEDAVVAYTLQSGEDVLAVIFNADSCSHEVKLPYANWVMLVDGTRAGTQVIGRIEADTLTVGPRSAHVLKQTCPDCIN